MSAAAKPHAGTASKTKECDACGEDIPVKALWCQHCGAPQEGVPCVNCGSVIPKGVTLCKECESYQDRVRRHIPGAQLTLAMIAAVVAAFAAAIPQITNWINLPSDTSALFLNTQHDAVSGNDHTSLTVRISNTGGRPAQVQDGRIIIPINGKAETTRLKITNRESIVVPPGASTDMRFYAAQITAMPADLAGLTTLAHQLCTADVKMVLRVRQRSRVWGTLGPPADIEPIEVPSEIARDWILEHKTLENFTKEDCSQ